MLILIHLRWDGFRRCLLHKIQIELLCFRFWPIFSDGNIDAGDIVTFRLDVGCYLSSFLPPAKGLAATSFVVVTVGSRTTSAKCECVRCVHVCFLRNKRKQWVGEYTSLWSRDQPRRYRAKSLRHLYYALFKRLVPCQSSIRMMYNRDQTHTHSPIPSLNIHKGEVHTCTYVYVYTKRSQRKWIYRQVNLHIFILIWNSTSVILFTSIVFDLDILCCVCFARLFKQ